LQPDCREGGGEKAIMWSRGLVAGSPQEKEKGKRKERLKGKKKKKEQREELNGMVSRK